MGIMTKWTVPKLAKTMGITANTLRNWIRKGEGPPCDVTITKRFLFHDTPGLKKWLDKFNMTLPGE